MPPIKDLTGKRLGKIEVVSPAEPIGGRTAWLCRCDCGTEKVLSSSNLRVTVSCGCIRVTPIEERFWAKVKKSDGDGCWEWQGSISSNGYGQISSGVGGNRPFTTHRLSWELHFGPIPADLFVCHHCDNRKCVRPDHLFLGTVQDNYDDSAAKGRTWTMPRKTHCSRGHEYSLYQDRQVCWICRKAKEAERKNGASL